MTVTEGAPKVSPPVDHERQAEWHRHPMLSGAVKVIVVMIPLIAATGAGLAVGWSITGSTLLANTTRVLAAGAASVLMFVAIERLTRRLLPLTMLLKLSMVFPDQAPSRFSVALRSTSVKKLQDWAQSAKDQDGTAALAEKVVTLASALNSHDRRTRGHSERTRAVAEVLGAQMELSPEEMNEIRWGAFLHDIGKILVPAHILNKPGAPTPAEWAILKEHPGAGGELVEPLRYFLGSGVEAVSQHHEDFDGTGYPMGLAGTEIALSARIVSVADTFEVITAVRSYKKPLSAEAARQELVRHSGSQFDPAIVRSLLDVSLGRLHWTVGLAAWMAELPLLTFIPRAAAQGAAIAAGPVVPLSAISGVAAVSLGVVAGHVPMSPAPTPTPPAAMAAVHASAAEEISASHATRTGEAISIDSSAHTVATSGAAATATTTTTTTTATTTVSAAPAPAAATPNVPSGANSGSPRSGQLPSTGSAPPVPSAPPIATVGPPSTTAVPPTPTIDASQGKSDATHPSATNAAAGSAAAAKTVRP